jgi:hypothetical protein
MSIENQLLENDKELENTLKYGEGAIYRLKELLGYDDVLKLWNEHRDKMRDRKCDHLKFVNYI